MLDFLSRPDGGTYVIAELGCNHLGDLEAARRMIVKAAAAGCDAVKIQKRTPEVAVPLEQQTKNYDTPWGPMSYLNYRYRMELTDLEYSMIAFYAKQEGIDWFASVWDTPSVDFMEEFDPICYKVPSACLTDTDLLKHIDAKGKPIILSTGMSEWEEIQEAVDCISVPLAIAHCTSTYPCPPEELNLEVMSLLMEYYKAPSKIGFSSHEDGTDATIAAVALGAEFVERHFTLDKDEWGSDQKFSLEPEEMASLVQRIRYVEKAIGDGVKRVYDSEMPAMQKLRRVHAAQPVA